MLENNIDEYALNHDSFCYQIFNFNTETINWKQYLETYCLGCKKYVMKEDQDEQPLARIKLKRWINY